MEINVNQILGLTVFSLEHGERIGQVRNFFLDPKEKELVALLVGNKKIIKDESILPLQDVTGISLEAITVDSPAVLRKKNDYPALKEYAKNPPDVVGLSILKKDGSFLGRAASFNIDTETGKITRIQLAGGVLRGMLKDRAYLPAEMIEVIGNEMILASDDAAVKAERGTEKAEKAAKQEKQDKGEKLRKALSLGKSPAKEDGFGDAIDTLAGKDFNHRNRRIVFTEIETEAKTDAPDEPKDQ